MLKFVRYINTLNIDTALGAVSFVFIVSSIREVEVDKFIYLALVISVLSIYNLDHLVDAYRLKDEQSSFRHSFYKKHFKKLIFWQLVLLMVGVWILFQLPAQVMYFGVIMSFFIGLYFFVIFKYHYKKYLFREVIIAGAYTFSVAIIPFVTPDAIVATGFYELLLIIFLLALTNLLVFALYDYDVDERQKHHSIARRVTRKNIILMANIIIVIACVIIILFFTHQQNWVVGGALLTVELIYFSMLHFQPFFKKNDYYRLIGELILALPGALLFVAKF